MDFDFSEAIGEYLSIILEQLQQINPRMMGISLEQLEAEVASDPLHQQVLSLIQQELAVANQPLKQS